MYREDFEREMFLALAISEKETGPVSQDEHLPVVIERSKRDTGMYSDDERRMKLALAISKTETGLDSDDDPQMELALALSVKESVRVSEDEELSAALAISEVDIGRQRGSVGHWTSGGGGACSTGGGAVGSTCSIGRGAVGSTCSTGGGARPHHSFRRQVYCPHCGRSRPVDTAPVELQKCPLCHVALVEM